MNEKKRATEKRAPTAVSFVGMAMRMGSEMADTRLPTKSHVNPPLSVPAMRMSPPAPLVAAATYICVCV